MTKTYSIVSNEYVNTGGHIMVNITTVYDYKHKTLLYVNINEEWLTVTTHDIVQNELPGEMCADDVTLVEISQDDFTTEPSFDNHAMLAIDDDMASLMLDCMEAFIKNYVKDSRQNYFTTVDKLPNVLREQLTDEYLNWLNEREQLIETDGYKIIIDDRYVECDTVNYKVAKELQQHLTESVKRLSDDEEEREEFYREKLQIIYCGKLFTFENGADVYNGLEDFVKFIVDNQ